MIFGCCREAKNGAVSCIAEVVPGCCFSDSVFNQPGLEIVLTFDALEKESLSFVGLFGGPAMASSLEKVITLA